MRSKTNYLVMQDLMAHALWGFPVWADEWWQMVKWSVCMQGNGVLLELPFGRVPTDSLDKSIGYVNYGCVPILNGINHGCEDD